MTRQKKTRKAGPLAAPKAAKDKRATETVAKGKKKGKGGAPGQRHSSPQVVNQDTPKNTEKDPRHGSQRKVTLIMTPEQELKQLQDDAQLQSLMERFANDETLTPKEQRYLDEKSERYEQLAAKLGYQLDDDWDDEEY